MRRTARDGGRVHDFIGDQLPSRVVFGAGASRAALAGEVERLGATRVLVLASTRDEERVAALTGPLGDRVTGVFTAVREHVPLPTAEAARAAAREAGGAMVRLVRLVRTAWTGGFDGPLPKPGTPLP
jgi:hypothetical protein